MLASCPLTALIRHQGSTSALWVPSKLLLERLIGNLSHPTPWKTLGLTGTSISGGEKQLVLSTNISNT